MLQVKRRAKDPLEEPVEDLVTSLDEGFVANEDIYAVLGCGADDVGGLQRRSTKIQRIVKRVFAKNGWKQARAIVRKPSVVDTTSAPNSTQKPKTTQVRGYVKGETVGLISLSAHTAKLELVSVGP